MEGSRACGLMNPPSAPFVSTISFASERLKAEIVLTFSTHTTRGSAEHIGCIF